MIEKENPGWIGKNYSPVKDYRAKNYAVVLYPEDMPENWLDILRETMFDMVISPLHDKDTNADGELKKAHYHVLFSAGNSWITMNQLVLLGKKLKGMAMPQKCSNPKGMVRYFIHIDNPEKYQYNKADILVIGQYDIEDFFKLTTGEEREVRQEIVTYILENNVTELAHLVMYAIYENEVWDDYISKNTIYINSIIKSVRHSFSKKEY